MATFNIIGNVVITDVNGSQRLIPLTNAITYSYDNMQTFKITAGSTNVIFNTADSIEQITPWVVLMLLPSLNLDLSMGIDAGQSDACWNSIPLTASEPFVLARNSFYGNYVNGASTNIFAGTSALTVLKMSVKEPTGTATGTLQMFMAL